MITIVDYGVGNLNSIQNMFKKLGVPSVISSDFEILQKAQKLVLPGVGSFDPAMKIILESGLKTILDQHALILKKPILGICLGMQLLTDGSEEGSIPGLGWIPGKTRAFRTVLNRDYKIPHMGWNTVQLRRPAPLVQGLESDARFYFVHSYFVKCHSGDHSLMTSEYGVEFDSIIQKDNIFGAQFHPEKSHRYGMRFLKNFSEIK